MKKDSLALLNMWNNRFHYLNQLRVDVGKLYISIGSVFLAAFVVFKDEIEILITFAAIPLLTIGFCVFFFEIKIRARSSAVAMEIKEILQDNYEKSSKIKSKQKRFDEDLLFGVMIATYNSFILVILLIFYLYYDDTKGMQSISVYKTECALLFVIILLLHVLIWKLSVAKISNCLNPLPD